MGSACSCLSNKSSQPPVDSQAQPSTNPQTTATTTIVASPAATTQSGSSGTATTDTTTTTDTTVESSVASSTSSSASNMSHTAPAKIAVIYYSMYGHIYKMAQAVVKGAESTGAQVTLLQVQETLSEDILKKMHAAPKPDVPVVQVADMPSYDGLIFGAPTRYGIPIAQYKALWDATGQLWQTGALNGKVAGFFTGTATQGGGQETTALTNMGHFVHHGMIFVPMGYGDPSIFKMDEVHGGSPWGPGTFSSVDGSRQPTELELGLARYHGKRIAEIAIALKKGRAAA